MRSWLSSFSMLLTLPLWGGCQPEDFNIQQKVDPEPDPVEEEPGVPLRQPDIEVEPEELRFGSRPPGCTSDPRTVTVRNVGNNPLQIHDLRIGGQQAGAYEILGDLPPTLRAGQEATFEVVFTPVDFIEYDRARVIIESNDPDEPEVRTGLVGLGSETATNEELFVQQQTSAVDVLFVHDNSGSMSSHIQNLRNGMDAFVQSFVNLGLDYRLGITTTHKDPPDALPGGGRMNIAGAEGWFVDDWMDEARNGSASAVINEFKRQTNLVIDDVGRSRAGDLEKGLGGAQMALTAPRINQAPNAGFIRDDATLAVAVISDEDDFSTVRPADFSTWLASVKGGDMGRVSFSGLVGPQNSGCGGLGGATSAPRYHTAINQTGGVWGNICQFDVQTFLRFLSFVAAGLEIRFPLQDEPVAATSQAIQVQVCAPDGSCQDAPRSAVDGWSYDGTSNAIEMNGDWLPDPGETLVVTYAVAADCPT